LGNVPVEGAEGKKYVWFDAPIGYISARMGCVKEKNGNHTGKIKTQSWFIL
jgi:methionyl-tRNA synthetase